VQVNLDVGAWIAGLGAVVVSAAIVVGYLSIPDPGEARALRLDNASLMTMQRIAASAQCAYTFTGHAPASIEDIRTAFLEHRTSVAGGICTIVQFTDAEAQTISYSAASEDSISLCAEFRLPSPKGTATNEFTMLTDFPELQQQRLSAGRHCYIIRLVRLTPLMGDPKL
jgi:hypothetical protein